MAVIRAASPAFELLQPSTLDGALALLNRYAGSASILAGGLDTFDAIVDGVRRPAILVDVGGIAELKGIRETSDGLDIGSTTPLAEVARNALVRERFRLLSDAAAAVGSPQIRNQGTIGGNVSQMTRCWYYRSGWSCYRAGGNACYADTPAGMTREHAILDLDRCVAVNPSDTAPVFIALGATMVIRSFGRERRVPAEEYFVGPSTDLDRMTVLGPGDLLTSIHVPNTWARAKFYFEKVRDRKVWDFALASVAAAMKVEGGRIADLRIAVNGVATRPKRLVAVEDAVRGHAVNETAAALAGEIAVRGATPLRYNVYKVALTRNLVKRAIRAARV